MMKRRTVWCGIFVMMSAGILSGLITTPAEAGPDGDVLEKIEAVKRSAEITKAHRAYKVLDGTFDHKIKWWLGPDSEPVEGEALVKRKRVLDVRFLVEKGKGNVGGAQFNTMIVYGYDSAAKEYTAVWMDSLGTKMLVTRGTYDESTKTFTFHGEYLDSVSGETTTVRSVLHVLDKKGNSHLEIFHTGADGKEFKWMEIESKRKVRRSA